MGTDRKGPLAAFVVIAIIAAILLVTSVRSQAEPNIVAQPPAGAPDLWAPVGGDTQAAVVQAGVTLVRRAIPHPSRVADRSRPSTVRPATVTSAAALSNRPLVSGSGTGSIVLRTMRQASHALRRAAARPTPRPVSRPALRPAVAPLPLGHGRHLGWGTTGPRHGHGRHLGWAKR